MSRKLVATICLSIALIAAHGAASAAFEIDEFGLPGEFALAAFGEAGAAAVLDLKIDDDGVAPPAYDRFIAVSPAHRGTGTSVSLDASTGSRFGAISAGPFSSLTYTRSFADGHAGPGSPTVGRQSLTGSLGLQGSARIDTGLGAIEPHIRLSLDRDFDIGHGAVGPLSGAARRSIYMEEVDVSEFQLENAISLKIKGRVPGLFFYETRIRVRTTGIREVSGRIKFRW